MQLVAPDIMADVVRLSSGTCILGLLLGLAVWLTGWWKRAFWIALIVTVSFGLYGFSVARSHGTHPLAAALLLGLSAGLLALELGRLIAFATGGLMTAVAVQTFVPNFPEPFMAYLAGGLICVLLFKLWMMTVLSFAGTMLMAHCGLALLGRVAHIETVAFATQKAGLLVVLTILGTAGGIVAQSRIESFFSNFKGRRKDKVIASLSEKEKAQLSGSQKSPGSKLMKLFKFKKAA
ncbi:MAG: hypothetical protein ACJ8C4_02370 [Gemmataceae bacterium]